MVIHTEVPYRHCSSSSRWKPILILYIAATAFLWLANCEPIRPQHDPRPTTSTDSARKDHVRLLYGVTADHKGMITCEVNTYSDVGVAADANGQAISTVYLICPQVTTSICYMDCKPSCVLNEHGCGTPRSISEVIERCAYNRINATRVAVNYVINLWALNHTGKWDCDYRGQRTMQPLELRAAEHSMIASSKGLDVNPSRSNEVLGGVVQRGNNKTERINRNLEEKDALAGNGLVKRLTEDFSIKLTRPELVVILLIAVSVSLLLNVALIVRCILMKSYLDNLAHGKPDGCLSKLLCLTHPLTHKTAFPQPRAALSLPAPYGDHLPFATEMSTNFIHYSASPDGRSSDTYGNTHGNPVMNGMLFSHPNFYDPEGYHHGNEATVAPIVSDETVGSGSSGPYSRVQRPPFFEDMAKPLAGESGNVMSIHHTSICPENPSRTNESLMGSVVLTNDSLSFTDAYATSNGLRGCATPLSKTPKSGVSLKHSRTEHNINWRSHRPDGAPSDRGQGTHSPRDTKSVTNRHVPSMIHSTVFGCASSESVELGGTKTARATERPRPPPPTMTPLVVRFPSGEAGLLLCPRLPSEEWGSLRRGRSHSHANHNRTKKLGRKEHHATARTNLLTTDSESDSGCTDFAFIDISGKELSGDSGPTDSPAAHYMSLPKSRPRTGCNLSSTATVTASACVASIVPYLDMVDHSNAYHPPPSPHKEKQTSWLVTPINTTDSNGESDRVIGNLEKTNC